MFELVMAKRNARGVPTGQKEHVTTADPEWLAEYAEAEFCKGVPGHKLSRAQSEFYGDAAEAEFLANQDCCV